MGHDREYECEEISLKPCIGMLSHPTSQHHACLQLTRGQKVIQTRPTSTSLCGEICITPPKYLRYERRRDFYSRCSIVVETLCVSKYGEGCNISDTCSRHSANHNALYSWPIRAHLAFQNDELCKNRLYNIT